MVIPCSLVLFFFLSFLVIIFHLVEGQDEFQSTCPKEFQCGKLGNMSFPFTDHRRPNCGLFFVTCEKSNEWINFWHDLKLTEAWQHIENYSMNQIEIEVPRSCLAFQNLSFPYDESTLFNITSKLTSLVTCDSSLSHDELLNYLPNHVEFRDCEVEHGFTIYFNNSGGMISDYNGPPPPPPLTRCLTIQVPLEKSSFDHNRPFEIFAKLISLEWKVTKPWPCDECFDDGHECIPVQDSNNRNTYHCSKGNINKLGLFLGSVLGGTIFILICGIIFIIWRQKKENEDGKYLNSRKSLAHCWEIESSEYQNIDNFLRNHGTGSTPKRFKYYDLKRITRSFKEKLGQGGFGSVFKGYLDDKNPVAVKFLTTSTGTGDDFINEVASISNTSHVNVVKLLGFCFEYKRRALVYEYMPNGSLEKYIFSDKSVVDHQLGWPTLFKIAVGIARGLEYLHLFCATRMVHFDIKPHNVLLDENFCPKISDFGLAKLCNENKSMLSLSGVRGTIGYIAPEVVCRNFGGVSHKSDVYSFGMMILEMVGGRKNSDIECNDSSQVYFPHWIYAQLERNQEIVLPSIANDAEKDSTRKMIIVSLWCIQTDPSHRPTMTKVVEMLEGDLDTLQMPPRPYLFSSANSVVADSSLLH